MRSLALASLALVLAACTGDAPSSQCPPDQAYFESRLWMPVLSSRCVTCHNATGLAASSGFIMDGDDMAATLDAVVARASAQVDGQPLLLAKPTGAVSHGGGMVIAVDSAEYRALSAFVDRVVGAPGACDDAIACQAGDPGPRLLRRLSRAEYDATIHALFGIASDHGAALTPDTVIDGFDNNARALTVSPLLADQLRGAAEAIAAEVAAQPEIGGCTGDGATCARAFLAGRAARIFRRPLADDEITRWLAVYQVGTETGADGVAPHRAGMELLVGGLLQSPAFLYRSELGVPGADGRYALTSYEIAAELSYLFWGESPDDELWAAAEADELRDPAAIEAHARRMLASPKARAAIDRFTSQWLGTDRLAIVPKDAEVYPQLTPSIRAAMAEEIGRLVVDVTQGGGSLTDLLTAPYTIANPELAAYYGVDAPGAPDASGYGRVDLAGSDRIGGLLGTGALLTTHARANSSSPIHRGKFVRERLLCQPLPPPPPGLNAQPPPLDDTSTTRAKYEQHATDAACAGCHGLMDPIGFAFEHFDGIGRFRADEHGLAIDDSGEILETASSDGAFHGLAELSTNLAQSAEVHACFATEWMRWAYGVEDDAEMACLLDELIERFEQGDLVIEELLVAITQTSHFRFRKAAGDEGEVGGGDTGGDSGGGDPGADAGTGGGGTTGGVTAQVVKTSTWETGYCARVDVTNDGASAVSWQVTTAVDGTIYNHWNCDVSQSGGQATFRALANDPPLAAGATYSAAGFCANL